MSMRVVKHPYNFPIRANFPNARAFRAWEGGGAYRAERDGKVFVIIDEGTLADCFDETDPAQQEILSRLVSVIDFEDESERQSYITQRMKVGIDLEGHRR
jgi:hypothetical protein